MLLPRKSSLVVRSSSRCRCWRGWCCLPAGCLRFFGISRVLVDGGRVAGCNYICNLVIYVRQWVPPVIKWAVVTCTRQTAPMVGLVITAVLLTWGEQVVDDIAQLWIAAKHRYIHTCQSTVLSQAQQQNINLVISIVACWITQIANQCSVI